MDSAAYHHRQVVAADILHGNSGAALRRYPVELVVYPAWDKRMAGTLHDIVHEMARHRNLSLRLLAERYSYGVADTVGKQRSDTHDSSRRGGFQRAPQGRAPMTAQEEEDFHGLDSGDSMGVGQGVLIVVAIVVFVAAILYILNSWIHFI